MDLKTTNEVTFEVTPIFYRIYKFWNDKEFQILSLQGGSRSSKTYSIIQQVIIYCQNHLNQNKRISIFRAKLTWVEVS